MKITGKKVEMKKLFLLLAFLFLVGAVSQTAAYNGFCDQGATQATTSGLPSSNWQQGQVKGCTVTVYLTGTKNKATIYKDANNTSLTNPFQVNPNTSQILFYAATGVGYDVVLSGGIPPNAYAAPVTITGVVASASGSVGVFPCVAGSAESFTCTGAVTAGSLNSVVNACQQSGADGGAKVNAADALLGATAGTITVDQSCGTTWTTPVVLNSGHSLAIVQRGTYTVPSISLLGNQTIDLGGATLQIPAYASTVSGYPAQIQTSLSSSVGTFITIQNGTLDGNFANTPSPTACGWQGCIIPLWIGGSGNTASHGVTIKNVQFTNWDNIGVWIGTTYTPGASQALPYNIQFMNDTFNYFGSYPIRISGMDRNVGVHGSYFTNYGIGNTYTDPIFVQDYTGYAGTSQFNLDISDHNIFENTQPQNAFVLESDPVGGWLTKFVFRGNTMRDLTGGSDDCLSIVASGALIDDNGWDSGGPCEVSGSNITVTGNRIKNGIITVESSLTNPATASVISGNTIKESGTAPNEKAIIVAGGPVLTPTFTQAIRQTSVSFTQTGGTLSSIAYTPWTGTTPPEITVNGTFSGGGSNAYQNWAFTLAGTNNSPDNAVSTNDGTFICVSSSTTQMVFVNPYGYSETLPSTATMTSSATTTTYIGSLTQASHAAGFNNLAGVPDVSVSGFSNSGNNGGPFLAIANSLNVLAVTNGGGVNETHSGSGSIPLINYGASVGPNSIDLGNTSGDCDGIEIGLYGWLGTVRNATFQGNNIAAEGPSAACWGVHFKTAATPLSSGIEIKNNPISGVVTGIGTDSASYGMTDLTITGNRLINVQDPIDFSILTNNPVLRIWDNPTSASDSSEILNGGASVSSLGQGGFPGGIANSNLSAPPTTGLFAEYDASANCTVDSASLSAWTDSSGNGYSLPGGATKAICKLSIKNGQPIVRYAGTENAYQVAYPAGSPGPGSYGFAQVVVYKKTIGASNVWLTDDYNYPQFASIYFPSATTISAIGNGGSGSIQNVAISDDGNFHVVIFVANPNNTEVLYLDGVQIGTGTATYPYLNGFTLGNHQPGDHSFVGDIAESLVYNVVPTDAELNAIDGFLAYKYGLPVAGTWSIINGKITLPVNLGAITWNSSGTCSYAVGGSLFAYATLATTSGQSCTLSPTGLLAGGSYTLEIDNAASTAATLTLGTGGSCSAWKVANGGSGAITLSGSSETDVLAFTFNGTSCLATFGGNFN